MKEYYRINEVARLYGLCADTLRYYEEQGVLSPARGENNYRLYSIQDICDLNIIQNLRSLDVPISKIRAYLSGRTVETTLELLAEEAALIDRHIDNLLQLRVGVERRARSIREARALPVGRYRLLELPPRPCYRLSEGLTLEKDVDYLLKKLEKKHEKELRIIGERQMGATLDADSLAQGVYNRYENAFFILEDESDHDAVIPGGQYASVVYRGPYEQLAGVLPQLYRWVRQEGLVPCGAPMELYHIDVHDTGRREEFLTEVQVLVR